MNVSAVWGELEEQFARRLRARDAGFFAAGLSLILHPRNPRVPTVHANWRFIQQGGKAWFGGGADLTPHYLFEEDAVHFHRVAPRGLRAARARQLRALQGRLRSLLLARPPATRRGAWAASSSRTPGGRWRRSSPSSRTAAGRFCPPYLPIVQRRRDLPYSAEHRRWQLLRRGRYVEFNLVYDRGTVFGLQTRGRTESILVSHAAPRWRGGTTCSPSREARRRSWWRSSATRAPGSEANARYARSLPRCPPTTTRSSSAPAPATSARSGSWSSATRRRSTRSRSAW